MASADTEEKGSFHAPLEGGAVLGRPLHPSPALGNPLLRGASRRSAGGVYTSTPCLRLFTRAGLPTCPHTGAPGLHGPGVTRVLPGASPHCTVIRGCSRGVLRERECPPPFPVDIFLGATIRWSLRLAFFFPPFQVGHLGPSRLSPHFKGGFPLCGRRPYGRPPSSLTRSRRGCAPLPWRAAAVRGRRCCCPAAEGQRRRCRCDATAGGPLPPWCSTTKDGTVVVAVPPLWAANFFLGASPL